MIDKRAKSRWERLNIAFENYILFIEEKEDKYKINYIDLLHVSNFKGGNSSITENISSVENKLLYHSDLMKSIDEKIHPLKLGKLDDKQFYSLLNYVDKIIDLTKEPITSIKGFGISHFSALYHAHFPDLIPILDRRLLYNSKIISYNSKSGPIKNIENYYSKLIEWTRQESCKDGMGLRQIDKKYFIIDFKTN